ncbi:class I tRNA ligase family protein [Collinsella stercoris]|uniref:class I tRNA ligase family protein n=1 Tax=Collinsella stercoris TaxID=147206 RepID=UPI0026EE014A|nr:class I tRNA ligase family protein [Collinsella stercoris]MBS6555902.1 class I tRNA ligase family protein [Collinsella stercoris]
MTTQPTRADRPAWPKRAVVTAGMPYGNKGLHFGHVGGVFVPADFYARFLRDRLGRENVIFVSGTDCYGSPIMEGFRKRREADDYEKHISDYVRENHDSQEADLASFGVSCDLYAGSALEPAVHIHERVTSEIIRRLHEKGALEKRSTKQFYDRKAGQLLNGRQVLGRCPIQGCKSEKAYADECDLGHQFEPEELIAPKSALTGEAPELVPVDNLYFDLPAYLEYLKGYTEQLEHDPTVRSVVSKTMEEWLNPAQLYIQNKFREAFDAIEGELPAHTVIEPEGNKSSFTVAFPSWRERDEAHEMLNAGGVRFRSGKALVPFRITGNVEWGVPVPNDCGCTDLTCWVWPESLWAPISFTRAVLARDAAKLEAAGADPSGLAECAVSDAELVGDAPAMIMAEPEYTHASLDWRDWWASEDARAYQFIGQDNIYFYCIAQSGMWEALDWNMQQSCVAANYHILYMGKKASSSSQTPPPLAHEMLEHYTPEQLRAHWLSLGLGEKPVSFSPKAFDARVSGKDKDGTEILACNDKRVIDPVLKEGAMLTGVFNRLARSAFYGVAVKEGDESPYRTGCIPAGAPSAKVSAETEQAILAFEQAMHTFELHHALGVCDEFLRAANKRWSDASKAAKNAEDDKLMTQALVDAFHELRAATVLMHGIVPSGCEKICEHFAIAPEVFFSWEHIFETCDELVAELGEQAGTHAIKVLPPRFDFFEKHPSQY